MVCCWKGMENLQCGSQNHEQGGSIFINQSGPYSLIFGSRLDQLKNLKDG